MKILVRVPNWIGDCVLAQPAIESIAANFPDAELWLSAAEWVKDIFSADSRIAGILPLPPENDVREHAGGRPKAQGPELSTSGCC